MSHLNPGAGPAWRSSRLETLAGDGVVAFESAGTAPASTLLPGEAALVARAVPKRVAEFAAGRACARAALDLLGSPGFELLNGEDRAPRWPPGITGSLSHTDGFCGAMAAPSARALGLGLDVELRRRVGPQLWRRICTPEEQRRLGALPQDEAAELGTLLFSAKEAFYKGQYPLTRQWLNFSDVAVLVRNDPPYGQALAGEFLVEPCRPLDVARLVAPPWRGRFLLDGGLVFTVVRMPS